MSRKILGVVFVYVLVLLIWDVVSEDLKKKGVCFRTKDIITHETDKNEWFKVINCCRDESREEVVVKTIEEPHCCSGYTNKSNICELICFKFCLNGKCVEPEKCGCSPGYKLKNNSTYECEPVCSNGCINGNCLGLEKCSCNPNYSFKKQSSNECEPVCSKKCVNGFCSAPETCSCSPGYKSKSGSKFQCEPVCSKGCKNGVCVGPEKCSCGKGYAFKKNSSYECVPFCSKSCSNGVCVEPEKCSCNNGYIFKKNSANQCEPFCSNDCRNGTCVEPEKCSCEKGYTFKDSTNECDNSSATAEAEVVDTSQSSVIINPWLALPIVVIISVIITWIVSTCRQKRSRLHLTAPNNNEISDKYNASFKVLLEEELEQDIVTYL